MPLKKSKITVISQACAQILQRLDEEKLELAVVQQEIKELLRAEQKMVLQSWDACSGYLN